MRDVTVWDVVEALLVFQYGGTKREDGSIECNSQVDATWVRRLHESVEHAKARWGYTEVDLDQLVDFLAVLNEDLMLS